MAIWNNAATVVCNGAPVAAVMYNGSVIWPTATGGSAYTELSISAFDTASKSLLGFHIVDADSTIVYASNGLHDISSYTEHITAQGTAPFTLNYSASSTAYDVCVPWPYRQNGTWSGNTISANVPWKTATENNSGAYITGSLTLKDSDNNPTDYQSACSVLKLRDYPKMMYAKGSTYRNTRNGSYYDGHYSAYGLITFVPKEPDIVTIGYWSSGWCGAYGSEINYKYGTVNLDNSLFTLTGASAYGWLNSGASPVTNSTATHYTAFDSFSGVKVNGHASARPSNYIGIRNGSGIQFRAVNSTAINLGLYRYDLDTQIWTGGRWQPLFSARASSNSGRQDVSGTYVYGDTVITAPRYIGACVENYWKNSIVAVSGNEPLYEIAVRVQ